MGGLLSKFDGDRIDGLGIEYKTKPRPTPASSRWAEHLILASAETYEFGPLPSILCALYYLGISHGDMLRLYEDYVLQLNRWPEEDAVAESIGEITMDEHLGDKQYALRYFEFFRDEMTDEPEWQDVTHKFLPVTMPRMYFGDFGPLLALAAAVEKDVPILAMYALGWACAVTEEPVDEKLSEFAADAVEDAEKKEAHDGVSFSEAYSAARAGAKTQGTNINDASGVARATASSIRVDMPHELISEMLTALNAMVDSPASAKLYLAVQATAEIVLAYTAVCTRAERDLALRLMAYRIAREQFAGNDEHKHTFSDAIVEPDLTRIFTLEHISDAPLARAQLWAGLFQQDRQVQ